MLYLAPNQHSLLMKQIPSISSSKASCSSNARGIPGVASNASPEGEEAETKLSEVRLVFSSKRYPVRHECDSVDDPLGPKALSMDPTMLMQ